MSKSVFAFYIASEVPLSVLSEVSCGSTPPPFPGATHDYQHPTDYEKCDVTFDLHGMTGLLGYGNASLVIDCSSFGR